MDAAEKFLSSDDSHLDDFLNAPDDSKPGLARAMGLSALGSMAKFGAGVIGAGGDALNSLGEEINQGSAGPGLSDLIVKQQPHSAVGDALKSAGGYLSGQAKSSSDAANAAQQQAVASRTSGLGRAVVEGAGLVPAIATTIGTDGLGGAAVFGLQGAGDKYAQTRYDRGLSASDAAKSAGIAGAVDTALGVIPAGKVLDKVAAKAVGEKVAPYVASVAHGGGVGVAFNEADKIQNSAEFGDKYRLGDGDLAAFLGGAVAGGIGRSVAGLASKAARPQEAGESPTTPDLTRSDLPQVEPDLRIQDVQETPNGGTPPALPPPPARPINVDGQLITAEDEQQLADAARQRSDSGMTPDVEATQTQHPSFTPVSPDDVASPEIQKALPPPEARPVTTGGQVITQAAERQAADAAQQRARDGLTPDIEKAQQQHPAFPALTPDEVAVASNATDTHPQDVNQTGVAALVHAATDNPDTAQDLVNQHESDASLTAAATGEAHPAQEPAQQSAGEAGQRNPVAPTPDEATGNAGQSGEPQGQVGGEVKRIKKAIASGVKPMLQRQQNARNSFINSAAEQFGVTKDQANSAANELVRLQLLKFDPATGQFNLKNGSVWDGDVIRRAAKNYDDLQNKPGSPDAGAPAGSNAPERAQPGRTAGVGGIPEPAGESGQGLRGTPQEPASGGGADVSVRDGQSEPKDSLSTRIKQHADDLLAMARNAGWAEIGGRVIRGAENERGLKAEVTGRTKWVPHEPWFSDVQRDAPLKKNKGGNATSEAVRKAVAGEKLSNPEQRHITSMLDVIDQDEADYQDQMRQSDAYGPELAQAAADNGLGSGYEPNLIDTAKLETAANIAGEEGFERAAVKYENDDKGLMKWAEDTINEHEQSAAANRSGETASSDTQGQRRLPAERAGTDEGFSLKTQSEAGLRKQDADNVKAQAAAVEERKRAEAPSPDSFNLTGSNRTADEGTAAGQQDMLGNSAAKPGHTDISKQKAAASKELESKQEINDFGEKLGGARKDKAPSLDQTLTDDDIANHPLSKIWPKAEIDKVEDKYTAAFLTAARAEIPTKPQKSYKLERWVRTVKTFRDLGHALLTTGKDKVEQGLSKAEGLHNFRAKVQVLNSIDRSEWPRIGDVSEHANAYRLVDGETVASPYVSYEVDGKRNIVGGVGSIDDAMDSVNKALGNEPASAKMKFEIRGKTNSNEYFINKHGDPERRKLRTFSSVADARAYINGNHDDLVRAWGDVKDRDNVKKTDVRNAENRPRTGADHRNGKDVTEQQFHDAFGFRGVEFGNYVKQGKDAKERQALLNQAYDALHDLSDIIGVPPKALSLEGSLGLGLGSRGRGAASAHFEPRNLVINLTKTRGAGTLAHEWFHALDNYFARKRGGEKPMKSGLGDGQQAYREGNFITYRPERGYIHKTAPGKPITAAELEAHRRNNPGSRYFRPENWIIDPKHPEGVRPEVEQKFGQLVDALNESPMAARAQSLDKGENGYWSRIIERGARSFENYVISKMLADGYHNDYLANVTDIEHFQSDKGRYPYLTPEEVKPISDAFDDLFHTIETKETDKGTSLFSRNSDAKEAPSSGASASSDNNAERVARTQRLVDLVSKDWENKPEIRVINGLDDPAAPKAARDANTAAKRNGAKGQPLGFIYQNKVYINADAARSPRSIVETLFHESLGHYGLRGVFGDKLDNELKSVALSRAKEVKAKLIEYGMKDSSENRLRAAEEVLASMAQKNPQLPVVRRAIAIIRNHLRPILNRLGIKLELTDDDIIQKYLAPAREFVKGGSGRSRGDAVSFSRDDKEPADAFYSKLQRTLESKLPNKSPAAIMSNMIDAFTRKGEFKKEELDWSGLQDWLGEQKGTVTKAQVLDHLNANNVDVQETIKGAEKDLPDDWKVTQEGDQHQVRGEYGEGIVRGTGRTRAEAIEDARGAWPNYFESKTKYEKYTTPGGENYKELLLTLPQRSPRLEHNDVFKSPHFDEPNILAHVRFNDRTGPDGEKILHVEEVQSDWHQKGRKQGYAGQPREGFTVYVDGNPSGTYENISEAEAHEKMALKHNDPSKVEIRKEIVREPVGSVREMGMPPNAPFKTTWPMLAMKRMIRYAAEHGYDKITWATGDQQAARYDLSKQVDSISVRPDATYRDVTVDHAGGSMEMSVDNNGNVTEGPSETIGKSLSDVIGKEAADRAMAAKSRTTLEGNGLKFGGEGMMAFYDKMLPNEMNKYVKKFRAKVGKTTQKGADQKEVGNMYRDGYTSDEIEKKLGSENDTQVHSIDITPQMRESVLHEGQPLFSRGDSPYDVVPDVETHPKEAAEVISRGLDIQNKDLMRAVGRGSIDHAYSVLDRVNTQTERGLRDFRKHFDKMLSTEAGTKSIREAIYQWETGKAVVDEKLAPFFSAMKKAFDQRVDAVIASGRELGYLDNYFPHLYKDPKKAKEWLSNYMARKPLEGSKGWTKERFYQTLEGAREAGLEPISENPADLMQAHLGQLDKYVAMHQIRSDLESRGLVMKDDPKRFRKPDGWATVNDPAFHGQLIPEMIAKDLNTTLGPSLNDAAAWRGFRKVENGLVSANLGLSGYHLTMTTGDTVAAHLGDAIQRAFIGDIAGSARSLADTIPSVVMAPIRGKHLMQQSLGERPADAQTAAVLRMLEQGGQRVFMSPTELNDSAVKLQRLLRQGEWRKSMKGAGVTAVEGAHALLENITPLIHKHLVPAQKMTAKVLAMKFELDALAHKLEQKRGDYAAIENALSEDAIRQIAGKVVGQVDDRLGQRNYRQLYMNRYVRDVMQGAFMSPGWQIGSARTIGGGIGDIRKLATGGDVIHGALDKSGTITDAKMSRLTGRTAYLVALHALVGGVAMGTTYALTGEGPKDLRDFYTIRTGRKNSDGTDERLSFPSYLKDELELAHGGVTQAAGNFTHMVENKLSPVFRIMGELSSNRDYYGNEIVDPDADESTKAQQIGAYMGNSITPFSARGIEKSVQAGGGAGQVAANVAGFNPAPGYMTRTPFQDVLYEHRSDHGHEVLTPDQAGKRQEFFQALDAMRSGQHPDLSSFSFKDRVKLSKYMRTSAPEAEYKRLDIRAKINAYNAATPAERKQYGLRRDLLTSKPNWNNLSDKQKTDVRTELMQIRANQ